MPRIGAFSLLRPTTRPAIAAAPAAGDRADRGRRLSGRRGMRLSSFFVPERLVVCVPFCATLLLVVVVLLIAVVVVV